MSTTEWFVQQLSTFQISMSVDTKILLTKLQMRETYKNYKFFKLNFDIFFNLLKLILYLTNTLLNIHENSNVIFKLTK